MTATPAAFQRELWQPPSELLRSTPRQVSLTAAGKAAVVAALLLAATAVAGGIGIYLQASADAEQFRRMRNEGVRVQAEVMETGRTRADQPRRFATYRYTVGAQPYRGRAVFRRADRRPLAPGSTLEVVYLPSSPGSSWLPGYEPRGVPVWLAPLMSAGLLAGAAGIGFALRRQRTLLSEGRAAMARVTGSKRVHVGGAHGGHARHRVQYEFQVLSGATRTGFFDVQKNPPPAGAVLSLLYDVDEPRRQARYPLSLVQTTPPARF